MAPSETQGLGSNEDVVPTLQENGGRLKTLDVWGSGGEMFMNVAPVPQLSGHMYHFFPSFISSSIH